MEGEGSQSPSQAEGRPPAAGVVAFLRCCTFPVPYGGPWKVSRAVWHAAVSGDPPAWRPRPHRARGRLETPPR
ncbi:MAG: hypothetical protein AVDCRST_MAG19-2327 [uncultured Thermomicrobiales bacterium]|uniref:Uncharacterized protein n=1 Tax=uncultured Thermomicrobiales bacterium TaxID=1645740 RepID=A0A6J4V6C5_9BACT|nr:MAG: hypothetical protein AVDCRST_MAG19-2327 [uncultured Thermomicrobiales bacterium]